MSWLDVPIRVRYGETDQMGHAYYANYLYWYEVARGEWCRSRGFTYKSLEAKGYFLPVVEIWTKYRGEIKYDEEISIRIRLAEVKRASLKFEYEVQNLNSGETTTEAYSWHVLMDRSRKAVSIPSELKDRLGG